MKFISASLLVVFFAATAHGLGIIFNPLPPARYGPPRFLAKITGSLFNPNQTTGTSPLFDLINTFTSNLYKPIADRINSAFFNNTGLGNALNYLTANIFGGGLCSFPPATTQSPMMWPGMPTTKGSAASNPTSAPKWSIGQMLKNLLKGKKKGGAGNPGSSGTSGDNSSLISALLAMLNKNSGSSSSSSTSSTKSMILNYLMGLASGTGTPGTGAGTPGTGAGTPGTGTGSSGTGTGNSPVPTVALEDLAKNLTVNPADLQTALNACHLTPTQLSQVLSAISQSHDQFHNDVVNHMNNITAAIQNCLNQLAQQASSGVKDVAKALNTPVSNLLASALECGIPVSSLNDIMEKLHLSIQAYLDLYTVTCKKNYPCFFQQLIKLFTNRGSGSSNGNGGGLGDTVTNGLNGLGKALGPQLGGTVTNLVGSLLTLVNHLLGGLLGGLK